MAVANKYSLHFNGSSYINLGNPSHLSLTQNLTIEMWIKPTNLAYTRYLISKAYGGEYEIRLLSGGQLRFYYGTSGINSSPYQIFTTTSTLEAGVWTHIAIVRDLENRRLYWYKNGLLTDETSANYDYAQASSYNVFIGRSNVTSGSQYLGEIDEIRIWNIARTSNEILENMNRRIQVHEEGLVGYWRFEEGIGNIVNDSSLYSHSGEVVGEAVWRPAEIDLSPMLIELDENPVLIKRGEIYEYKFSINNVIVPTKESKRFEKVGSIYTLPINKRDWSSIDKIRFKV